MLFYPNNTVNIFRWNKYQTPADMGIVVYIYEQSDTQDAMSWVEGAQNEKRLLTVFTGIRNRDKLVTVDGQTYIVKKVKHRTSPIEDFLECQIRETND